jgi:hypothetical protein
MIVINLTETLHFIGNGNPESLSDLLKGYTVSSAGTKIQVSQYLGQNKLHSITLLFVTLPFSHYKFSDCLMKFNLF